jgi:hypothetical protein
MDTEQTGLEHGETQRQQGAVAFRYRLQVEGSAGGRRGLMTVPLAERIRRYLLHVPEPGTKVVRCYGLYAPTKGADLARCREPSGKGQWCSRRC